MDDGRQMADDGWQNLDLITAGSRAHEP
jgi:hypothetical protein